MGRALTAIDENEYYLNENGSKGNCSDSLNLTIRADGHVAVCCAGSDLTESLWIGNINTSSINSIAEMVEWNILIKKLVHQGPSSFFEILRNAGLEYKIKKSYTNICHACYELFNDPDVVREVRKWIQETQRNALIKSIKNISKGINEETNKNMTTVTNTSDLIEIKKLRHSY